MNNDTSLLSYLQTATNGATGILGALNNKSAPKATTTTPAKSNTTLYLIGGGIVLVVIALVLSFGRK